MESIADRVDLVKRAAEAQIEITRQLGAELVLAQGEIRVIRGEGAKLDAALRKLVAAHQVELLARTQAEAERDRLQGELDDMDSAVNQIRKVFSGTYGRGEALIMQQLTEPMKRAIASLLSKPGHYRQGGAAPEAPLQPAEYRVESPVPVATSDQT